MTPRQYLQLTCTALLWLGTQALLAHSQSNPESQTMDHAQIQSTIDSNNAAVAASDIDAILATYEANATLLAQPGMAVTGTASLRDAFKRFTGLQPKITPVGQEVVQSGDIALHTYNWTMTGKAPDGSAIQQSGFSIIVLRKQEDGRWLVVIDNPFGATQLKRN